MKPIRPRKSCKEGNLELTIELLNSLDCSRRVNYFKELTQCRSEVITDCTTNIGIHEQRKTLAQSSAVV